METELDNTVYIERNINIQNITHLQQYKYLDKFIYIMGERHNIVSVLCPVEPITVAEYISIALLTNDKADFIAEQTSYGKLENLISSNIRSTYETIKSSSLIREDRYKYAEYRPLFFWPDNTHLLNNLYYARINEIGENTITYIINSFIKPFFNKQKLLEFENNHVFLNLQEDVKEGIREVKGQIYDDFVSIKEELVEFRETSKHFFENINSINDINIKEIKEDIFKYTLDVINRIRFLWLRVNDYFILPDLFDTRQSETFLLMGSHHSENLRNIFENFNQKNIPVIMLRNYENPEGCINILTPIHLYGENISATLSQIEAIQNKKDYTDYEKEIIDLLRNDL